MGGRVGNAAETYKEKQRQINVLCRRIHTFYVVTGIELEG